MVVARNIGRLGNNMFQIGASIGYSRKFGFEWAADYGSGVGEPYSAIHKVFPNLPKAELHGIRYHEHKNEFCRQHDTHKDICHFDYHPLPNMGPNVSLSGFFQSYKYFEGADEEIKNVFALPHIPGYEDYVSIHVRRGDYVQHAGSFPPITLDYLISSISKMYLAIKGNYHEWDLKFMVFSDDIEFCKTNLFKINEDCRPAGKFEFSEGRSEAEDLALMTSCGHHIIANSTFSWWAAYLGHNPDRIVISPSHKKGNWFGGSSGIQKDCVDLLPPTWHQIEWRTI